MARATQQMIMGEIFLTLATAADAVPPAPESVVPQILAWVTGFVSMVLVAVFTFLKPLWLREGRKQEHARLQGSVVIEGQPIGMKMHPEYATRAELELMRSKFDDEIDGAHSRISAAFRGLDTVRGKLEGIDENVGRLLDIALRQPPGTTRAKRKAEDQ